MKNFSVSRYSMGGVEFFLVLILDSRGLLMLC